MTNAKVEAKPSETHEKQASKKPENDALPNTKKHDKMSTSRNRSMWDNQNPKCDINSETRQSRSTSGSTEVAAMSPQWVHDDDYPETGSTHGRADAPSRRSVRHRARSGRDACQSAAHRTHPRLVADLASLLECSQISEQPKFERCASDQPKCCRIGGMRSVRPLVFLHKVGQLHSDGYAGCGSTAP